MMLGDDECDEEIAYFLKYGKNKPYKRTCKNAQPQHDYERDNEPNPYYLWQGTRIPQWFE